METITIIYKGIALEVEFFYQPEEEETGTHEGVDINDMNISGIDVWELLEDQIEDIEKEVLTQRDINYGYSIISKHE
jgi:hypothetical protein